RARADDRAGDPRSRQQPGERDVRRLVPQLGAQVLVGLHLVVVALHELLRATFRAPFALGLLAEDPAQESAVQRTPGDDAETVVLRGRDDLELDLASREVVE